MRFFRSDPTISLELLVAIKTVFRNDQLGLSIEPRRAGFAPRLHGRLRVQSVPTGAYQQQRNIVAAKDAAFMSFSSSRERFERSKRALRFRNVSS